MTTAPQAIHPSSWAPLRRPLFRDRWLASIVSNVGTWMQDTAGAWLMASLTHSPLLIALMQTAAGLPVLLVGLAAGATADIFDRRRLLLFWQTWMLATVALLSFLTLAGRIQPGMLLALTFLLNIGAAMNNPAWQAIVPELVPRAELPDAIAMNSAGFNLARAVGPALGGLAVAAFAHAVTGAGVVFLLNSASFIAVIIVLARWRRVPLFRSALPAERLFGSIRSGMRYLRFAPVLQSVLARAFLFTLFASAVWALLPVVAQQSLHRGAMAYGLLNGCLGAGAVLGASLLGRVRRHLTGDHIIASSSMIFVAALLVLAVSHNVPLIVFCLIAAGFAWTSTTSTMNVAIQLSVPAWVQARSLGTYQMVFWGGMAAGSSLWGFLAENANTRYSLIAAAVGLALSLPLAARFHVLRDGPPDMSPYRLNRPAPAVAVELAHGDGPVLVTVEYRIRDVDQPAFINAVHQLRSVRLGDGAMRWGIYQDTVQPDRFVETFLVESWLEFLRERERMTASGREVLDRVRGFHAGSAPPLPSYMLYAREAGE